MPIPLRTDFDATTVRIAARKSKNGAQAWRLLALAAMPRTGLACPPGRFHVAAKAKDFPSVTRSFSTVAGASPLSRFSASHFATSCCDISVSNSFPNRGIKCPLITASVFSGRF